MIFSIMVSLFVKINILTFTCEVYCIVHGDGVMPGADSWKLHWLHLMLHMSRFRKMNHNA